MFNDFINLKLMRRLIYIQYLSLILKLCYLSQHPFIFFVSGSNAANEFKANTTIKFGINAWKSEDLKIDFSISRMESVHNNDNDNYANSVNFGIRYTF